MPTMRPDPYVAALMDFASKNPEVDNAIRAFAAKHPNAQAREPFDYFLGFTQSHPSEMRDPIYRAAKVLAPAGHEPTRNGTCHRSR